MTSSGTPGEGEVGRLASVDTETRARRRHPSRGGPPRPPAPGLRWTARAYSLVIGVCAASALLWVVLIGTTLGMFGAVVAKQADLAVQLAEMSAQCGAQDDSAALLRAEDPEGPAAGTHPVSVRK